MTRRQELEKLSPVKLYDLMLEYGIPVCKREIAINKIIEMENVPKVERKPPNTKLKAARIFAGLSQKDLASHADININTLRAYEQGYKPFSSARIDTILKVAIACNSKIEDLIENKDYIELMEKYMAMIKTR